MTTRILHESGVIALDPTTKKFRVRLINEGEGSSADYLREFFTQENADALAGSLSWAGHPFDPEHPEMRDPMGAIASVGDTVTIEEEAGKLSFWSDYIPAKSKPEVAAYLDEYGPKLGLSIFIESSGRESETGKWIAESLRGDDPYRSVDLVIAAGRGGKIDRVAEAALRKITEASAPAEGKEVIMDLETLGKNVAALTTLVENLATTLTTKAVAEAQVEADDAKVTTIVESRLADYNKAVILISEAKLTESQSDELRARALKGEDITSSVEREKKVLTEAFALAGKSEDSVDHLGGGDSKAKASFGIAGFGKVS